MQTRKTVIAIIILVANVYFCSWAAQAERLVLPSQLIEIEEEAFYGNSSIKEVIIQENAIRIGDRAFANCSMLGSVTIPLGVKTFGNDILRPSQILCKPPKQGVK